MRHVISFYLLFFDAMLTSRGHRHHHAGMPSQTNTNYNFVFQRKNLRNATSDAGQIWYESRMTPKPEGARQRNNKRSLCTTGKPCFCSRRL